MPRPLVEIVDETRKLHDLSGSASIRETVLSRLRYAYLVASLHDAFTRFTASAPTTRPGCLISPGSKPIGTARTEERRCPLSDPHARSVDRLSYTKNTDDLCANFLERRFKELSSRIDAERR